MANWRLIGGLGTLFLAYLAFVLQTIADAR